MTRRRKFYIVLLLIFFVVNAAAEAQNRAYALRQVRKLTAKRYWGRGYTHKGMELAAEYLEREFKRNGAEPYLGSYRQLFTYKINRFLANPEVSINGRKLRCGLDYIPDATSGGYTGHARLIQVDDDEYETREPGLCVRLVDKLTFSAAQRQHWQGIILLLRNAMDKLPEECDIRLEPEMAQFTAANVTGYIKGRNNNDSLVVVTAHYDHLGSIGNKAVFPGGNDNASGTAMLLDMMRHYGKMQPENNILFIAFAGEEAGLVGSTYFMRYYRGDARKIKYVLNLDLMGNGDKGVTVVNGEDNPGIYNRLLEANAKLTIPLTLKARGNAANSDHYPFTQGGVPAVFLYTMGGTAHYHDVKDTGDNVPYPVYDSVFKLIEAVTGR